jgi:ABC-type glycerol-3-phosphate transport system substrate-binding protein
MSTFQLVVTSIFVGFIIIGVGAFALFGGVFGGGGVGQVTMWGTVPQGTMENMIEALRVDDDSFDNVLYVEQDPGTYESVLLNAMASGSGPDLFLVTQEELGGFMDKIIPIPYGVVSQSQFISSYVDEGQLFLTREGALALPVMIDPLVMYWNRDHFASAGVSQPPTLWSQFTEQNGLPTKINAYNNAQLRRSAVAMGGWSNVLHAKEILSTLFMQAGEFITGRRADGAYVATFGTTPQGISNNPAESALRFYTEFGNPSKTTYSWNRSLPQSDEAFVSGIVAVYFGYASELRSIGERNPNLRFGVSVMPQLQGSGTQITYGKMTGVAIPKTAANVQGAALVAQKITSAPAAQALVQLTGLPSARRDVVLDTSASASAEVFVRSALIARGWVDPSAPQTDLVFRDMIESVISGRNEPAGAVSQAAQEFQQLIPVTF